MEISKKNCKIADKIIQVLAEEKCTVEETQDILNAVIREIKRSSTVQIGKKFSEVYHV